MAQEQKLILKRQCVSCHSTTTSVEKNGYTHWHQIPEGWLCKKCYNRLHTNPKWNLITNPINSPRWNPIKNPKRIVFTPIRKQVPLSFNPRKGICSNCGRSISKGEVKTTHMHHLKYDLNDPLAHTVELCASCHRKDHLKVVK